MLVMKAPMRVVDQLAFSHDGARLFAASTCGDFTQAEGARGVAVWDGDATDPTDVLLPESLIAGFAASPAGRWLYVGVGRRYGDAASISGYVAYDLTTHDLRSLGVRCGNAFVIAPHPSGKWLIGLGQTEGKRTNRLVRWSQPARGTATIAWENLSEQPSSFTCQVACDPAHEGRFVALNFEQWGVAGLTPFNLIVRDAKSGEFRERVPVPDGVTGRILFSPDGARLVVVCGPSLWAWDGDDLTRPPVKAKGTSRKYITGVAFHPTGKYLAASSNDETVALYDARTWEVIRAFTWKVGQLRSVAFSPDGTRAAVGSDTGKVVVWDVDL